MTFIQELIDTLEHIGKGQFVLRLADGVADSQWTVDTYVATPQLVECFDDALHFIRGGQLYHLEFPSIDVKSPALRSRYCAVSFPDPQDDCTVTVRDGDNQRSE